MALRDTLPKIKGTGFAAKTYKKGIGIPKE